MNPPELLRLGVIDAVIPEPKGGAHRDPVKAAENIRKAIDQSLSEMLEEGGLANGRASSKKSGTAGKKAAAAKPNFMMERTEKFRAMGQAALAHAPGSNS
jgi:hypothetical protein